jgi:hypothetical protein
VYFEVYFGVKSDIGKLAEELVVAYGVGAIDDAMLERGLEYLKRLGVSETELALVRMRARLRRTLGRARGLARVRS